MRFLKIALFVSLLGVNLAHAEPASAPAERARIADLERIAADQARAVVALQREVAALKSASPAMRSRPSRSVANVALAALSIRHPVAAGAFGLPLLGGAPLFAYPGGGGSTSAGALGSAGLPSGCTDNTIARADGTAGATQCSDAVLSDTEVLSGVTQLTLSGAAAVVSAASTTLTLQAGASAGIAFNSNGATARAQIDSDGVKIAAAHGLYFFDTNVAIAESGTNDLSFTSDGAVSATLSGGAASVLALGATSGELRGLTVDGASAVGVRISANADYTTGGAKIASFGDNAGTSYAEKVYFDLNGAAVFVGGQAPATTVSGIAGTGTTLMVYNVATAGTHDFTVAGSTELSIAAAGTTVGGNVIATGGAFQMTDSSVQIGESGTNDLLITAAGGDVTTTAALSAAGYRGVINSTLTSAASDLTAAQFRASHVFPADTSANAVDVEISEALDALDVGMEKQFRVATGHATQALTVTADGAGVTSVVTVQQGAGATCEDANDSIRVTVRATTALLVETYCAD